MLNTFASLQHINQFDFQAAWEVLSENLNLYPKSYKTKEDFQAVASAVCDPFPVELSSLTEEDHKAIAGKVWDEHHN